MKVLQLTTGLSFAGAERIILDLCRMPEHQFVIAGLQSGDGRFARLAAAQGVRVADLGMAHKLDWRVWRRLRCLVDDEGFDVVHTHLAHANFLGRLAGASQGIPVVSTMHIAGERRWLHAWMERATVSRARAVVAVSNAVYVHAVDEVGLPADKMQVIYNGIDTERFSPGYTERDVDVLFVGRLSPQKGLDRLLPALKAASSKRVLSIAIVGYGPDGDALKRQARELDLDADWVGFSDRPEAWMVRSKVCVMPSRWEGFGLVAAEAMACGCRVAHSSLDVLGGVCGPHGVPLSDDVERWPSRILEALDWEDIRGEGRDRVLQRYDRRHMVDSYRRLYERCVGRRG